MNIGVLSDIHDNITNLRKAFSVFKKQKVEKVIFCGDLASAFTVGYFKELGLPVWTVWGNNEGDRLGVIRRIKKHQLDIQYAPKAGLMWQLKLGNKKVVIFHGHQYEITNTLVNSGLFDVVLTGHTHCSHVKTAAKTLWLNSGSVCGWVDLDLKPVKSSVAVLNLTNLQAEIIEL
ncbi:metallophosphoesterase [Patescibacteria group bacterium]|nr:metallophosphoesterase [Patescibacteria group bacterium]MBU1931893.1 metallophosphoesterase [Patescibacteria group bacterium]